MWSVFRARLSVEEENLQRTPASQQADGPALPSNRLPMEGLLLPAALLLEQIFEGLAGVARARGRRCDGACSLRVRSGRGVFLDCHAKLVELAIVPGILRRDALANGLRALELRAGIEEAALLAAMQFELALGTLAVGVETGGQDGAAIGAARSSDGSDHAGSARAELIGAARTTGRRLLFVRALALLTFLRIAVTAMTILAIH